MLSDALFCKSLRMFARKQGALMLSRAQHCGWSLPGTAQGRSPDSQGSANLLPQGSMWRLCTNTFPAPGPSLHPSGAGGGQGVGRCRLEVPPVLPMGSQASDS